jgi:2-C-methyl-D-erythritol 2,4-cyclodiphosphate synthase
MKVKGDSMFRIGQGYDVHRLKEGRPLILGGVNIPYLLGLDGHSDADVLIHSLIDALLGALALGDIGSWFPDTDDKYKGIDSTLLLKEVINSGDFSNYNVSNIDITIIAQKPKLLPYINDMRRVLAEIISLDLGQVSIKATTTEKLGFCGRGEGIAVSSIVLLMRK